MSDPFYPSVDLAFIEECVRGSEKLAEDGIVKFGSTTIFIIKGTRPIFKRNMTVREIEPGQICLEQATAIAFRFSFMPALLSWLEEKKHWKEGAYIVA